MKLSLLQLAEHLELLAEGQDIITRLSPHLTSGGYQDDLEVTRDTTAQAARVLLAFSEIEDEARELLKAKRAKKRSGE